MYKIINTNSGNVQIMNQEDKDIFFSHSKKQIKDWNKYGKRNMYKDYDVQPVRFIDNIPTWDFVERYEQDGVQYIHRARS